MWTRPPRWLAATLWLALVGCSGTEPVPATAIAMVLGDNQHGKVGQLLGLPFLVQVTDRKGAGVADIPVSWSVTSGDGALEGLWEDCNDFDDERGNPLDTASVRTDLGGFAWVSFMPEWFGPVTVAAEVTGLEGSPVIFTTDATDVEAAVEIAYQPDREVIAAATKSYQLVVWVTDGLGDGAPGVPVTWQVSSGAGDFRPEHGGCSRQDIDPTTMIQRTIDGLSAVKFRPTAFGVTTVTVAVTGLQGPPVTFTLDVTVIEIGLSLGYEGTEFFGPTGSSDVAVTVGATVEWWDGNDSARITSTSVPPGGTSFDSGVLSFDERFQFVPGVAGTWEYVDQVSGATGTLTAVAQ